MPTQTALIDGIAGIWIPATDAPITPYPTGMGGGVVSPATQAPTIPVGSPTADANPFIVKPDGSLGWGLTPGEEALINEVTSNPLQGMDEYIEHAGKATPESVTGSIPYIGDVAGGAISGAVAYAVTGDAQHAIAVGLGATIGGVAGTIAGSAVGGPLGGVVGGMVGGAIGEGIAGLLVPPDSNLNPDGLGPDANVYALPGGGASKLYGLRITFTYGGRSCVGDRPANGFGDVNTVTYGPFQGPLGAFWTEKNGNLSCTNLKEPKNRGYFWFVDAAGVRVLVRNYQTGYPASVWFPSDGNPSIEVTDWATGEPDSSTPPTGDRPSTGTPSLPSAEPSTGTPSADPDDKPKSPVAPVPVGEGDDDSQPVTDPATGTPSIPGIGGPPLPGIGTPDSPAPVPSPENREPSSTAEPEGATECNPCQALSELRDIILDNFGVETELQWETHECGDDVPVSGQSTGSGLIGIGSAIGELSRQLNSLAQRQYCQPSDVAIPEAIVGRVDREIPRLVLTWKDIDSNSRWTTTVPHASLTQTEAQNLPAVNIVRGSRCVTYTEANSYASSVIRVNADGDELPFETLLSLIAPGHSFMKKVTLGAQYPTKTIYLKQVAFWSRGLNQQSYPDWTVRF